MEFIRPHILWALTLVAVPIWLHLKGRGKRKPTTIPSLMWLDKVRPASVLRRRLRDLIVLLARVLLIVFIVLSLAGPKNRGIEAKVQIDNYPAGWEQAENWLQKSVDLLDEGTYSIFDRQGNHRGIYAKSALISVAQTFAPTTKKLVPVEDATLLTYGFEKVTHTQALIARRKSQRNEKIHVERNALGGYIFSTDSACTYQLLIDSQIFDEQLNTSYTVDSKELRADSSIVLQVLCDDIQEDNRFEFARNTSSKRGVFYVGQAPKLGAFGLADDTLIPFNSGQQYDYHAFSSLVFIGLENIPIPAQQIDLNKIHFMPTTSQEVLGTGNPVLEHPFYANYFIGPTVQNAWPEVLSFDQGIASDGGLLEYEGRTVAALQGRVYRQSYIPNNWSHPYYKALAQWSVGTAVGLKYIEYLGQDSYSENAAIKERSKDLWSTEQSTNAMNWLSLEKMYLLLALLCAVIALIFVKI